MGVIHKLKPEILSFIIEHKQNNPALSCRNLTSQILAQFQINISKSSINAIFKENNLSMPIGRRPHLKKRKFNMPVLPVLEGVRAVTLVEESIKSIQVQAVDLTLQVAKEAQEQVVQAAEEKKRLGEEAELKAKKEKAEKLAQEAKEAEEQKAITEAAQKAQQEKLAKEAQEQVVQAAEKKKRLEEEAELKAKREKAEKLAQEAKEAEEQKVIAEAAQKAQQEKLAKEAQEQAAQAAEEKKRLEEEAELKAERERWARLAEEELKSKPQVAVEDISMQKDQANLNGALPSDGACSGAIFLKAIDYLIGGSKQINEVICKRTGNHPEDYLALTQAIIFRSLFGPEKEDFDLLCSLVGQQISQEKLENYYAEIKQNKTLRLDVARIISNAFTEARGVKVHFIDGNILYLDGQLHTTWSTPYLPYDFANATHDLKNNLNKYFFEGEPLVLLSAPGYDLPTKEFFNLLLNISSANKGPDSLILYGNKLEEFESISLNQQNNCSFIFGLWPWQFTTSRKIKKIGNFNLEHIEGIEKDLYLAELEIELLQPAINQSVTLHGCAVKTSLKEKIRVVILSSDQSLVHLNRLAQLYLSRWPNLEECFGDFSHKVEVFTYAGSAQSFFSIESFGLSKLETDLELAETFANYIKILDAYLRWHFLPSEWVEKDFSFARECFYKVQAKLAISPMRAIVKVQDSPEQSFSKDLEYLMRRLNERQINLGDDKILYFENAFK